MAALSHVYMDESAEDEGTTWMAPMVRSWEEITEDETGGLKSTQLQEQKKRKKHLLATTAAGAGSVIERGVIRYLYVIVDCSWNMNMKDMRPTRKDLVLDLLEPFITEFFDQNPISQLGFIVSAEGRAYSLTELSGNPSSQIQALRENTRNGGDFSLQNSLDLARAKLSSIPPYGSREVLVVMGALSTADPGDIHETITACQQNHMTCSVIALAAEMYVSTLLATTTGGSASVVLNRDHFSQLLMNHIPPIPAHKASARQKQSRKWIHMGFPEQKYQSYPSLCACHEELRYGGFNCSKCLSKFCELPTECKICNLTLVSSPHLARSYHHLFPVVPYRVIGHNLEEENDERAAAANAMETEGEKKEQEEKKPAVKLTVVAAAPSSSITRPANLVSTFCRACRLLLTPSDSLQMQCPTCEWIFCIDCDEYIHTILHNCPGCLSTNTPKKVSQFAENNTIAADVKPSPLGSPESLDSPPTASPASAAAGSNTPNPIDMSDK